MFKKYTKVRQENSNDCGVACLLIIIKKYKGNIAIEQLRYLTKTNHDGTSAFNLIETAKKIGFEAKGYTCNDISKITALPCIAHIILSNNYQHFVVIDKIDLKHKKIIVIDPSNGIKKYPLDDFMKIWSGVILLFKPHSIISNNYHNHSLKRLWYIMRPHYKSFIFLLILSIIYTFLSLTNMFYTKLIIDNYHQNIFFFLSLFIFFSMITLIKISSDYLRNLILIKVDKKIDDKLMIDTYKHLFSLPYYYFYSRCTGDITSKINDLSYVREIIGRVSVVILVDLILALLSLYILFHINFFLFGISMIMIILYLLIVWLFNPIINRMITKLQKQQEVSQAYLIESINNVTTVKNLEISDYIINNFNIRYKTLLDINYKFSKTYCFQKLLKDIIIYGGFVLILYFSSILLSQNKLTLSNFILYNSILIYLWDPIKNLFDLEPLFKNAMNALKRINELYMVNSEKRGYNGSIKGDISFCNLTFSYDDYSDILKSLSLTIKSGQKIIITGESGSGKSTLFKLLIKYYDIKNNMIKIGNRDINTYTTGDLRSHICYVSQEEKLFADTIYNNMILGRKMQDEDYELIKKITYIDNIINKRNSNDQMMIEEGGHNLSGGERQRLIIARSLLSKANVFIFDETTSEIDEHLERKILSNIFSTYINKTFIIISHHTKNADLYDQIIMLEDGKINSITTRKENLCTN